MDGPRVAGAGTILWGRHPATEVVHRVAGAAMAFPASGRSQTAEAWGARMAIDLVCPSGADRRHSPVSGDNLAVVRFCAGQARLRRPAMQSVIDPGLARLMLEGRGIQRLAVRRRLNMAADAIATGAVHWAIRLRAGGSLEPQQEVRWLGLAAAPREEHAEPDEDRDGRPG